MQEVNVNQADALEKIKSGEIAATVLFSGKPVNVFALISAADNLHFLAVPFTSTLENTYVPAELEADAYPNLIAKGEIVHTIGVDAVLITTNLSKGNEKFRRLARFVDAFFKKFPDLRKPPRHPKWREVNLSAISRAGDASPRRRNGSIAPKRRSWRSCRSVSSNSCRN